MIRQECGYSVVEQNITRLLYTIALNMSKQKVPTTPIKPDIRKGTL